MFIRFGIESPVDDQENAEHEQNIELGPTAHTMFGMVNGPRTVILVTLPFFRG